MMNWAVASQSNSHLSTVVFQYRQRSLRPQRSVEITFLLNHLPPDYYHMQGVLYVSHGRCIIESHVDVHVVTFVVGRLPARKRSGRASRAAHNTFIIRLHATDASTHSSGIGFLPVATDCISATSEAANVSAFTSRRTGSLSTEEYWTNGAGVPV